MPKYLGTFFMLALLMGSCAPAPTPPPTVTATQTATPSPTPATPISVPQTSEHLVVTRDNKHWAFLNADGSLQKYMEIQDISGPASVSPDGNWLPYELGSFEAEPYDYTLSLLNLHDGTLQFVTTLFSPDFPKNIEPIVKSTFHYDSSLYGEDCADIKCRRSLVEDEIEISAGMSQWSPDGQFLAFVAQIDGPSTDIYLYSMQDKTIRRLTDDLQNVDRMEWSPDGKRLFYANNIPGITYGRRTFYVTDLEGKTLEFSNGILAELSRWYTHGWISNDQYLLQADYLDDPPQFRQLVVLNVKNGQMTEIWPYTTQDCVIDTTNQTVVLLFRNKNNYDLPSSGVYRVSTNGDYEQISDQRFYELTADSQITAEGDDEAYHITSDNSINLIGASLSGLSNVYTSPDKKWFFIEDFVEARQRLTLYNDQYQQTKSWMFDDDLWTVTWRPDSLGIFLFTENNIYYLAIPDGEPQLLNVKVPSWSCDVCNDIAYKWPWFTWRP